MPSEAPRLQWLLAAVLALGAASVTGLARFGYALLLPAMHADLSWTYSQAGMVGAANSFGYLAGALLTMRLVDRWGDRRTYLLGLALTSCALFGSGATREYPSQLAFRALAGLGAAGTFVCGGVLASSLQLHVGGRLRSGLGVTVFFAGGGLGLLASGAVVPLWLEAQGNPGWSAAWTFMGMVGVFSTVAGLAAVRLVDQPRIHSERIGWPFRDYRAVFISYTLFGLGYIAYMTFVVAWMNYRGAAPGEVAVTWSLLGIATLIAPTLWGERFHHLGGGRPMAEALALLAVGASLPLLSASLVMACVSALLVGVSVFMVPAAMTLLIRSELPSDARSQALSALTICFATGQIIGPVVTGWLADVTGSLFTGLAFSGVVLVLACGTALTQRARSLTQAVVREPACDAV